VSAPPATLTAVCQAMWDLERRHGLLSLEVGGVRVWEAERMPIYYRLCEALGVFQRPHAAAPGPAARVRARATRMLHGLTRNPFLARPRPDVLVFPHSRVRREDGAVRDVYTDAYCRRLRAEGRRVLTVQPRFPGVDAGLIAAPEVRTDAFPALLTAALRATRRRVPLGTEAAATARAAGEALHDALGVRLDLEALFADRAARFLAAHRVYRGLLARLRPREVVVVVGYWLAPLIRAARESGIPVTEVQHGVMTPYHLGYSFPEGTGRPAYFADRFLAWGPYWTESLPFPLPPERVEVIGFDHFRAQAARYRDLTRDPDRVVVISQGALGPRLADLMWHNREAFRGREVRYKLHPGEYDRWRGYEGLKRLAALDNVTVETDTDLYALLAGAGTQVGVFSTALFEGFALGCRTVLCDLPGVEYMTPLVEKYGIPVCRGDDLAGILARDDLPTVPAERFF